jgi:hypothetical protein
METDYINEKGMATIHFDRQLLDLEGKPMKENDQVILLNKSLANNLVSGSRGDAVKFYDWALKLYKDGSLTLDRSDFEMLKKFVESLDSVSILYKAQLLDCFSLAPDKKISNL